KGRERPGHVALRRLDLDDVGAEVGEQHGAEGSGQRLRQVDDADIGERPAPDAGHGRPRRLTSTGRSPSKTIVPSCFVPQWRKRTTPASSRPASRFSSTSVYA